MVRKESVGDRVHNDELIEVKARLFEDAVENIRPETILDSRQILDKIVANETKAELFWTSDVAIYSMFHFFSTNIYDDTKYPSLKIGVNSKDVTRRNPLIYSGYGKITEHATDSLVEYGKFEIRARHHLNGVFCDITDRTYDMAPISLERLAGEIEPASCDEKSMKMDFLIKPGTKSSEIYIKDTVKKRFSNEWKTETRKVQPKHTQTVYLLGSLFGNDYEKSGIITKLTKKHIEEIHIRLPSPKFVSENTRSDSEGLAYFCTLCIWGENRKVLSYNAFNHGYDSYKPTLIGKRK